MNRDLRFINKFDKQNIDDLSWENVFAYFFFSQKRVLFIVDDDSKLLGIITLGSFINNSVNIQDAINEKYLFVESASLDRMFSKAHEIYDKYRIESDIPVIDSEKKIIGYITDYKINADKKVAYEDKLEKAKVKISRYQSSFYLKKEIESFYHVMANTEIYARDCQEFYKIFSLFNEKIKIKVLSDKDYMLLIKKLSEKQNVYTENEKTKLIFDFEWGNRTALYASLNLMSIYDLEKFMEEFTYLVENGEFSRIVRITESANYQLNDFISDMKIEEIKFESNRLLTKYIYDYMKKNHISIFLTYTGSFATMQCSSITNGIRGSSKDYIGFIFCDLIEQQKNFAEMLSVRNISVLNFLSAVNAKLTENEKKWFACHGTPETLLERKDVESLELLYQGDCEKGMAVEYAKKIHYLWPLKRRFENDIVLYVDYNSTYINIENGIRRTCYQPEKYVNTIYFIGPCCAFGPFVEDKHTIPSLLSKKLTDDGYFYRVVNLGILASNTSPELLSSLSLKEGDIIINMIFNENAERMRSIFGNIIDPSGAFDAILNRKEMFFDKSVHVNRAGNETYADVIYGYVKPALKQACNVPMKRNNIYDVFKINFSDLHIYKIQEYINMLQKEKEKVSHDMKVIGSIVMNCNPFTLGHQHLIEYALQNCEYLFVFIVEENKSYFKYDDRFAIAVANCKKYKNISVLPAGNMIISDITFPEYFERELVRDNADSEKYIKITPVADLRIFATYIAPVLGISKRFIAEEPLDSLTKQYNEYMKKILPIFDVSVEEIPRKTLTDGQIINASKVRAMYRNRNFEKMKELLPEETYNYLVEIADHYLEKDTVV